MLGRLWVVLDNSPERPSYTKAFTYATRLNVWRTIDHLSLLFREVDSPISIYATMFGFDDKDRVIKKSLSHGGLIADEKVTKRKTLVFILCTLFSFR